jgi:excisionase family DNA binding protein
MIDTLLTREQAAEIFGVSPRTIDAWLRTGELHRANTPGRIVRIAHSEIERRLQIAPQMTVEPTPEA